jgi:hypothetical protein
MGSRVAWRGPCRVAILSFLGFTILADGFTILADGWAMVLGRCCRCAAPVAAAAV